MAWDFIVKLTPLLPRFAATTRHEVQSGADVGARPASGMTSEAR
jgi:hypothetical protein